VYVNNNFTIMLLSMKDMNTRSIVIINKLLYYFIFIICMSLFMLNESVAQDSTTTSGLSSREIEASGTFMPSGPPSGKPERIAAGKSCIVNLVQSYNISGTLTGTIELNYRILVKGPCGSPPGTFDEEWIAYGTFKGKFIDVDVSGNMSYTATVKAGGNVDGQIVLGQELEGNLQVYGNFKDEKLSYNGKIRCAKH
jgi:hypothetical protein